MARQPRVSVRERFWREAVAAWRASGLSVRAFCAQRQLREPSFYSWRRELQRRAPQPALPSAPTFVPVRVIPGVTLAVEVRCPSGHVVSLPNADAVMLRSLFAALAPVPPC